MSAGDSPVTPTPAEIEILEVLWARGPSTVREVHEALGARRKTGYTTILKLMQIMAQKQLLTRDESRRSHVYAPAIARERVQGSLLGELIDRAFSGSTGELVMRALSSRRASAEELDEIRELLDNLDDDGANKGRKRKKGRAR